MVKSKSDDVQLSLRFKHGLTTIFLLVDAQDTFDKITAVLLEALRERYPDGIDGGLVPIPQDNDDVHIAYGILKKPQDPSSGWSDLNVAEGDTPVSRGVKDNTPLAFAFIGDDDDEPKFNVEFPQMEYEGEGSDDMAE